MLSDFPAAVPEIPVSDVHKAAEYYVKNLGFKIDWGGEDGGIAGMSRGNCRLFLTNPSFREPYGNVGPVMVWLNLDSKTEVNELYEQWKGPRQGLFLSQRRSRGSCSNLWQPILMEICSALSTIFRVMSSRRL